MTPHDYDPFDEFRDAMVLLVAALGGLMILAARLWAVLS